MRSLQEPLHPTSDTDGKGAETVSLCVALSMYMFLSQRLKHARYFLFGFYSGQSVWSAADLSLIHPNPKLTH